MSSAELITQLRSENEQLKQTINSLTEQLEWFKRQIFGHRSEKLIPTSNGELTLPGLEFLPVEKIEEVQTVETHQRKKVNRQGQDKIILPDDLPVERVVLDLPEKEKVCQETGLPLIKIGEEISRKLAHRPGSYYIKEFVRTKYASSQSSAEGVKAVDLPDSLLNR